MRFKRRCTALATRLSVQPNKLTFAFQQADAGDRPHQRVRGRLQGTECREWAR